MLRFTDEDTLIISVTLEGFFYGLYTGIFAMYLQYHASKQDTSKTQNFIFYSICALYVLTVAVFVGDLTVFAYQVFFSKPLEPIFCIYFIQITSFGCGDFIAQLIIIYRCWIVWGRNIRVVIIPALLTFAFLVIWVVGESSTYIFSDQLSIPEWGSWMTLTGLALSLTVNALVTGLIVFRIFKVFREVKATSGDKILGTTGGSKLRRIIFILIESGMALFSVQLARLVVTFVNGAVTASSVIASIHNMLNGITPTIILVRTSMGLSFHDEKSMEEFAIGSFASNHLASVPETGSINITGRNSRDDEDIDVRRSNDIDIQVV